MDEKTKEESSSQASEAEKTESVSAPRRTESSQAPETAAQTEAAPAMVAETANESGREAPVETGTPVAEKPVAPVARSGRIRVAPRGDFRRIKPGLRARVRPHAADGTKRADEPEVSEEKKEISPERRYRDDRRPPADIHELLGEHLKLRAESADPKLRAQLMGSLLIKFSSSGERFLFDWTTDKLDMGFREAANADCVMTISEQNFMRIVNGSLNPQIAILSDKINVSGKLSMAVYWFNLLAARSSAV